MSTGKASYSQVGTVVLGVALSLAAPAKDYYLGAASRRIRRDARRKEWWK